MKKTTVLVIEDDKWLAEQYVRVLSRAGFETKVAYHAISAIQFIDKKLPDAIILDILLTGSTAFTLLHELQSYADTGAIPIVLCTSLAGDLPSNTLGYYGVKKILDKTTMRPDDLISSVRSVL